MATTDAARLVFVDECGTHISMTRRRARAPRGTRAVGAVPRNRGPVTTLITGLALSGMSPAMTVEGGTTAAVFAAYLQQVLLPALRPGQVVVVDNVGAHKPERMRALVEAAGCRLVFLPDFSPVEEAFSKIKALVKAAGARTRAALDAAIAVALAAVTATDAAGWFAHAGYSTHQAT
ncbi:IS630 family transposase [Geodermatophilus sp. URMC 62]|uniref:IS630 family transposase n=1 Tax=Geodermatophilus sp. URMC 62 TaxID=3423414 RepID=UPI00406C6D93